MQTFKKPLFDRKSLKTEMIRFLLNDGKSFTVILLHCSAAITTRLAARNDRTLGRHDMRSYKVVPENTNTVKYAVTKINIAMQFVNL